MKTTTILFAAICGFLGRNTLLADESFTPVPSAKSQDKLAIPAPAIQVLAVQPRAESKLPLDHRFWLPMHELLPGSGDLFFSRAAIMWSRTPDDVKATVETLLAGETEVSKEEISKTIEALGDVYAELRKLSMVRQTGFDNRLRDLTGIAIFSYTLPELQESRNFARLLKIKASFEIERGETREAIDTIRDGFRLATYVANGETILHQLIGIAVEGLMIDCVEHMIQTEDSPNLYWALATLPKPLIHIQDALQFEIDLMPRAIKALGESENDEHTDAYWKTAWEKTLNDLGSLTGDTTATTEAFNTLLENNSQSIRDRLIQSGMNPNKVASMPRERVVLLDSLMEIRQLSQHAMKGTFLPAHLSQAMVATQVQSIDQFLAKNGKNSGASVIMGMMFPNVETLQNAQHRQSYLINRLMTIEALRMHAAVHAGLLPDSLAELSPVPALPNPFTNENFDYQVTREGETQTVTLSGTTPAKLNFYRQIEIRFGSLEKSK